MKDLIKQLDQQSIDFLIAFANTYIGQIPYIDEKNLSGLNPTYLLLRLKARESILKGTDGILARAIIAELEGKNKYPELKELAVKLANEVCVKINKLAPKVKDDSMQYKTQFVLEEMIKILEARV